MKKNIIYIVVIIFFFVSITFAYMFGKKRSFIQVDEKQFINNRQSITKETRYACLEKIATNLNDNTDTLNLTKKFSSYAEAYAPLYKLTNDYKYSTKTNDGEIISVSKYIQGTYKVDENISIDVIIVQDKTFENGGFIYINNNKENHVLYKYNESFLIFRYSYDISSDIDINKKTSDFIKKFFLQYYNAYVTVDENGS